jgi:hypothetical protein
MACPCRGRVVPTLDRFDEVYPSEGIVLAEIANAGDG